MANAQFERTALLIGDSALDALASSCVCVFGIGGVGGAVVDALARAGVGALDLVDSDVVEESNINRQWVARHSTLGRAKVEVAREMVLDINPECSVRIHRCFYLPETAEQFDFASYDYIVDAVDTVTAKLNLIEEAHRAGSPIICAMGAGNKMDPTAFRIADIYDTTICPLSKIIRKECRKRGIEALKVAYSTEPAIWTNTPETPGSTPCVPPAMGLAIAAEVVRDLTACASAPERPAHRPPTR